MKDLPSPHDELLPLKKKGTNDGHAALAIKLKLLGIRGIIAAEKAGALRFGSFQNGNYTVTLWGIGDTTDRAAAFRHLDGPPLVDDTGERSGADYGDLSYPIGIDDVGQCASIGIVHGPENRIAAEYFWGEQFDLKIVTMLGLGPIADDVLPSFAGKDVYLGDLHDPTTAPAFATWRSQLIKAGANVLNVVTRGWRFADGRPARSFFELQHVHWEAMQA